MKRRIHKNRFDNWNGYEGGRKVIEFGNSPSETAEQAANRWLEETTMTRLHDAYLIVLCSNDDNSIVGADVWSSPEWKQSLCRTDVRTFVALHRATYGKSFDDAMSALIHEISNPRHRYHYLYQRLPEELRPAA